MIRQMIKVLGLISTAIILLSVCLPALAEGDADKPDLDTLGSISVIMKDSETDEPVAGGSLTLYYIATIREEEGGTYLYEYTDQFVGADFSLHDPNSAELADGLAEYALNNNIVGETQTISDDGRVMFCDLRTGLYLFIQKEAPKGYNTVRPFIIPIPIKDDVGVGWIFDINAGPKVEIISHSEVTPTPSHYPGEESPTPSSEPTPTGSHSPGNPNGSTPSTPEKLPQTGQLNWPVPVLTFSGLIIFGIGYALRFLKKDKGNA